MKTKCLLSLLAIVLSMPALALDRAGNGGDAVHCEHWEKDDDGFPKHTTYSAQLLDYYEGESLRKLTIDLGRENLDPLAKVRLVLRRLHRLDPRRAFNLNEHLVRFMEEARFLPDVYLTDIPDSHHVALPRGCRLEQVALQKEPLFPEDPYYIINKDIWELFDNNHKAGLILHELVFRQALAAGHTNSIRTRYYTAIISSSKMNHMTQEQYLQVLRDTDLPIHFVWNQGTEKELWWEWTDLVSSYWVHDDRDFKTLCKSRGGRFPTLQETWDIREELGQALFDRDLITDSSGAFFFATQGPEWLMVRVSRDGMNFWSEWHNADRIMCVFDSNPYPADGL